MKKKPNSADNEVLLQVISQQQETIQKLNEQLEQLQFRLDQLLRVLYGTKSEKKPKPPPEPGTPASPPDKASPGNQNKKDPKSSSSNANGRRPLPADLRRERVVHEIPEEQRQCKCCPLDLQRMGKVVTEQLEFKPGELYVIEHIRVKYGCQKCKDDIMAAPLPPQPIDKGLPGPGLLTEVILNKYQYHCPLNRQEQRFANLGIELRRSTLCDWVKQVGTLLKPIVELMKTDVLIPGERIFSDDTTCPVLAKDKTYTGRLWVYIGWGKDEPICVIYDYTKSRSQTAPQRFLKGYQGYLQADAYNGYDIPYKDGNLNHINTFIYLKDVLTRLPTTLMKDLAQLLPYNWKPLA